MTKQSTVSSLERVNQSSAEPSAASGGGPKYLGIAAVLRGELGERYRPGDWLPAEDQLADRFQVNRHTLRRAVEALQEEGLVLRQQGRGTMVLAPAIDYGIHGQTRFTETITSAGHAARSIVTGRRIERATGGVARRLVLKEGTRVVRLDMLRLADDVPLLLTTVFLPADPFEPLMLDYDGGSLHALIAKDFGITPRRSQSLISAQLPTEDDALALRLSPRVPVLRVKSVNINPSTGRPVEYVLSRFRADRVELNVAPGTLDSIERGS